MLEELREKKEKKIQKGVILAIKTQIGQKWKDRKENSIKWQQQQQKQG